MDEGRLALFLSAQEGAAVEVQKIRRLAAANPRVLYIVDSTAGQLLVRMQQDDSPGLSIRDEAALVQSLHEAAIPVAISQWFEPTGEVLGQPFAVTDFIEALPGADGMSADSPASSSFVATLHGLHKLKPEPHLPAVDPQQTTHIQIEFWRTVGKSAGGRRVPLLDAAEMWLHQRAPQPKRTTLVHGMPEPGNASVADGAVVALTDWEFAHVGDPSEDWSYLASTQSSSASVREWRTLIEQEAGVRLSPDEWSYWDAFNLFKRACINRTCLAQFERGANRAPKMAILGTAVYHDLLLRLMRTID